MIAAIETKPFCRRTTGQAGFSLVEVSIASLVVAVLIGSILTTVTHGFGILSRSRETVRGNQILQGELETMRTYSWSQITNSGTFTNSTISDGGVIYSVTRSAAQYTNSTTYGSNYMRKVTISILWTNMTGDPITKSMTTLISQGGLDDYIY